MMILYPFECKDQLLSPNNLDDIINYKIYIFSLYHTINQTLKAPCIQIFACYYMCIELTQLKAHK